MGYRGVIDAPLRCRKIAFVVLGFGRETKGAAISRRHQCAFAISMGYRGAFAMSQNRTRRIGFWLRDQRSGDIAETPMRLCDVDGISRRYRYAFVLNRFYDSKGL